MQSSVAVLIVSVCAISVLSGCASLANRVVLPGSYLKPPSNVVAPSPSYELVTLRTAAGESIAAQFGRALRPDGQPFDQSANAPTVLFFYGNRMCLAASQGIFDDLRRMGANVLIPEYPGYGMSPGKPSEQACYRAADSAYAYVISRKDMDPKRVVIAGLSIGCGPAIDLAARVEPHGLVLVVPLPSIRETGSDDLPWYLRWAAPIVARYAAFDNVAKLPRVSAPVLLVEATRNQVTSATRSRELERAIRGRATVVKVESDHDGSWAAGRSDIASWLKAFDARPN